MIYLLFCVWTVCFVYAVVNKMATNKLMKGVTLKYKADYILIHRWLQADEAV